MKQQPKPKPTKPAARPEPRAAARPAVANWHGVTLTDEFAWLKDDNWQAVIRDPAGLQPDIRAYLEAENEFAAATLADTEQLQTRLLAELRGRIKEDDSSVPTPDGRYAYFSSYLPGAQHPQLRREPRDGGASNVLLDGDVLAHGKSFFQLGDACHSPDHKYIAWLADEAGSEFYTARIRDIASGGDLADIIPEATGAVVWTRDASAFYYVRLDQNHRPHYVYRHRLGSQASDD